MSTTCPYCGMHHDNTTCPNCEIEPGIKLFKELLTSIEEIGLDKSSRDAWFIAAENLKTTNPRLHKTLFKTAGEYLDELHAQTAQSSENERAIKALRKRFGTKTLRKMTVIEMLTALLVQ